MLLLSILHLLREEALERQPERARFSAELANATITDESCFDTIACYTADAFAFLPDEP